MTQGTFSSETQKKKPSGFQVLVPAAILLVVCLSALFIMRKKVTPPKPAAQESVMGNLPQVGDVLEDFDLKPVEGKPLKLSSIPGKIFLINVWATWCSPCVAEMPSIVQLREKFHADGFEVIGMNVDEDPEEVLAAFEKKLGMKFQSFSDRDGWFSDRFGVSAIPFSIVIDSSRKVLYVEHGDRDWFSEEAQNQVKGWLQEAGR